MPGPRFEITKDREPLAIGDIGEGTQVEDFASIILNVFNSLINESIIMESDIVYLKLFDGNGFSFAGEKNTVTKVMATLSQSLPRLNQGSIE